ncbi:porin [Rhodopirellula sp.]|nr:porin [Rhodopirellula sp.]MDB4474877.1 porin [bacterium]
MIRANQIPITLLLTIAATCCNGQTEDSTKTGASISQSTENFATHFLQTDHLPASEQFVSPEEVKNGSFPFTDSDIRPTETSFLLPPQGLLEFEHADSFSTLGRTKTQQGTPTATGDLQQESTATVQAEPSSELNPGVVQALFDYRLTEADRNQTDFSVIDPVNFQVDDINNFNMPLDGPVLQSSAAYADSGVNAVAQFNVGVDLYAAPDFKNGLLIYGDNVAMKIGGYVKADFIYDFDPIDSTDSFDTTQIPVDALPRTNARFHARQSRISFDTRWKGDGKIVKIYVEGDFFSAADTFRLRQAYGESGRLLVGKTWTAFSDVAAAPATLDFEGSVSSVTRRQAQARYTFPICDDLLTGTLSLEDTKFIIDLEPAAGTSRSPSPDFVGNVRLATDLIQLQAGVLYREVGFQPTNAETITRSAGGMNFTGVLMLTGRTKAYSQLLYGKGIGSYRSLPDAASINSTDAALLPMFGWMIGLTHEWTDLLSSNFTYADNEINNSVGQSDDAVKKTTYMAINLLAKPQNRITVGIEYLYGTRTNKSLASAGAHRVQAAVIFDLP